MIQIVTKCLSKKYFGLAFACFQFEPPLLVLVQILSNQEWIFFLYKNISATACSTIPIAPVDIKNTFRRIPLFVL